MTQTAELSDTEHTEQHAPASTAQDPTITEMVPAEEALNGTVHPPVLLPTCPKIEISLLSEHPNYQRENDTLDPQFTASIANDGVKNPVLIVPNTEKPGAFWVLDGVLRMRAAVLADRKDLPYYRDSEIDYDRAKQLLRAIQLNDERMITPKTAYDQMTILGLAVGAGATQAAVRTSLGLTTKEARARWRTAKVLAAPSDELKEVLAGISQDPNSGFQQASMEDLALLAAFDRQPAALSAFEAYRAQGEPPGYAAQKVKQDLEEQAELDKAAAALDQTIAEFTANGGQLVDETPQGGLSLGDLRVVSDEEGPRPLTLEDHGDCPGRAIRIMDDYRGRWLMHLCLDPYAHGHAFASSHTAAKLKLRHELIQAGRTVTMNVPWNATRLSKIHVDGELITPEQHASCPGSAVGLEGWGEPEAVEYCSDAEANEHTLIEKATTRAQLGDEPSMRLRRDGKSAWKATADPRRAFLTEYLKGRTNLPKTVSAFTLNTLFQMPPTIRDAFTDRETGALFEQLTGRSPDQAETTMSSETLADGRRQVYLFGRVAAAMERQIVGDTIRDYTWRTDGHKTNSHCPRDLAGAYLDLLISEGHQAASIERAVAEGQPYLGDGTTMPGDGDLMDDSTDEAVSGDETETPGDETGADLAAPDQDDPTAGETGDEPVPDPGEADLAEVA